MMGEGLGKTMSIVNKDNTPFPFCHFPEADRIRIGQIDPRGIRHGHPPRVRRRFQVRPGEPGGLLSRSISTTTIPTSPTRTSIGSIPGLPPSARWSSNWENASGPPYRPKAADYLYCAIVSDTGSFQFSNTTAKAFETCYKLTSLGASPIKVSEMLYSNNPPEKIKLLGQVLSTLRMNGRGNIAAITMFKKNLSDLNLKEIDTEDITTLARSIKGVEMVLFFKEMEKDTFRVSLRSKGGANAALVAEHFGGGGHVHASGFTAYGPYEKLIVEIPEIVERLLTTVAVRISGLPDPSARKAAPWTD